MGLLAGITVRFIIFVRLVSPRLQLNVEWKQGDVAGQQARQTA
jgi:hypothetical protein